MITLKGKYNSLIVQTDNIDKTTGKQLIELLDQEFIKDSNIVIMPDCHAGIGCVIGTTMTIEDKVCPNLVGIDIGCGISVYPLRDKEIDFKKVDNFIDMYIPAGMNKQVNTTDIYSDDTTGYREELFKQGCICINALFAPVNKHNAQLSLGTLGGGNHFIEIDKDDNDNYYLLIHTGSRHLGVEVCNYYQELAYIKLTNNDKERKKLIEELKAAGREKEIQAELLKLQPKKINKELAYLENYDYAKYMHDMKATQKYALFNRTLIADKIINGCELTIDLQSKIIDTAHNYIDTENSMLRKGAISAQKGEQVVIPLNMADGAILATGLGNKEWNYSAPHGAGRVMSRKQANEHVDIDEFMDRMKDIYSTSVSLTTLDEAPQVYKNKDEIIKLIQPTVNINKIIKPVYNFKAH